MNLETELLVQFISTHPAEAARAMESMPTADAAEVIEDLPAEVCAGLFRWLSPTTAANALGRLPVEEAAQAISATRRDLAAAVLRTVDAEPRAAILAAVDSEVRNALRRLLRFAEGTAGALMDPGVISASQRVSVADALERVRHNPQHALYYLYVVDDEQKLVGVVNIRELMGARQDQPLGLVAVRDVASIPARASWDSVLAHPAWRRVHALPVVETDGRFLGVIRYESVREVEEGREEDRVEDEAGRTASAVGELFGIGLRGLFDLAASAVFGSTESERRRS